MAVAMVWMKGREGERRRAAYSLVMVEVLHSCREGGWTHMKHIRTVSHMRAHTSTHASKLRCVKAQVGVWNEDS